MNAPRDQAARDALTREFLVWVGEADRHDAVMLLEQSQFPDTDTLAMVLARRLHEQPPGAVRRKITPLGALSLAVLLLNGEAVDPDLDAFDEDGIAAAVALLSQGRVRGVFDTAQQAAFAAVRQLGGAQRFGVPDHVEAALGDPTHDVPQELLDNVALLADTNHGWYFERAYALGFVLYRTNDR